MVDVARTRPAGRTDGPAPKARPHWRSVAVPAEHGGWGLTLEPIVLGLVVAPSAAGLSVGVAAVLAFLARTPLKLVLVDARRRRCLPRTVLARQVLAVELALIAVSLAYLALVAPAGAWVPLVGVVPLVVLELWFDMRSRSRRLVPELAGAVGITGVVAVIVLVGGEDLRLAGALWLVLIARALTSIVTVRDQVGRLHGRGADPRRTSLADLVALGSAAAAVAVDASLLLGALAVVVVVVVQRALGRDPLPRAVVLGLRQTALGLVVVAASAVGVLVA